MIAISQEHHNEHYNELGDNQAILLEAGCAYSIRSTANHNLTQFLSQQAN